MGITATLNQGNKFIDAILRASEDGRAQSVVLARTRWRLGKPGKRTTFSLLMAGRSVA